jgi:hypothetical protein
MVDESVLPTVKINSPAQGSEAQQGSPLLVSAVATDAVGITRVQLLANNQLVKTVSSESVNGDPEMSVVLDYIPRLTGNVELRVVAFRGTIASEPSVLTVQVVTELTDSVEVIQNNSGQVAANGVNANDPTCRILTNVDLNYRTGPGTTNTRDPPRPLLCEVVKPLPKREVVTDASQAAAALSWPPAKAPGRGHGSLSLRQPSCVPSRKTAEAWLLCTANRVTNQQLAQAEGISI